MTHVDKIAGIPLPVSAWFFMKKAGRKGVCRANPALTTSEHRRFDMAFSPITPGVRFTQAFGEAI